MTAQHAAAVEELQWVHRDPFDRLLVARALTENGALAARDAQLSQYGVTVVF